MPHRYILTAVLTATLLLASSCADGFGQQRASPPALPSATETTPPTSLPPIQAEQPWQALDLRFAHVLDVTYEILEPTRVRFDVTLVHDDDGEAPQFADWWQVEDEQGSVLGTRILTHSHGSQPFTRSATIDIPSGTRIVIIRGHDMNHGFGGQAISLDLQSGAMENLTTDP